jgi:hypothetical protein
MGNVSEYKRQRYITQLWETAMGLPWDPFDPCTIHTQRELVAKCGALVAAR